MILESIIFNMVAFILFIIIFFEIIKKNDANYIYLLGIQALGIFISFIQLMAGFRMPVFLRLIIYTFSIVLPVGIIIMEKELLNFSEAFYIAKAKIQMLQDKKEKAKDTYIQLLNKYPDSYYGHKFFAKYYEARGDQGTALEEYYRALKVRMDDYDTFFRIAQINKKLEYTDKAQECLKEILQKKPDYKNASLLLGEILYENGKYKQAINIYTEALKYNSLEYELYYYLGMAYTKINDFQRAKAFYEQAASLNSYAYNVKYGLAQIALISNDFIEAEKYFMEALNGIDVEAKAYYYLARIALLKGEENKAINYINTAIEVNPDIFEIVKENPMFMKIKKEIIRKMSEPKEIGLTKMEKESFEHLEDTYELVAKLKFKRNTKEEYEEVEEQKQIEEHKIIDDEQKAKEEFIRNIMEKEC